MNPLHEIILKDLRTDLHQMLEEGHAEADLSRELEAAEGSLQALSELQWAWWHRPSPPDFPYDEPNDWESISAGFPDPASHAVFAGTDELLADRLHAAWLGRCAGCQLGKPLEGTASPAKIKTVLQTVGSWPLRDYMNPAPEGLTPAQLPDCNFFQRNPEWRNTLCKGRFDHVAPDDDLHYALVALRLLEWQGPGFTPAQVLENLLTLSPVQGLWAAGRNLFRTGLYGVKPPWTAFLGNPCRQSLGAQIRCDVFGWCAPGNPALAASMAYRDAVTSQTRNGIYSGIFFAVLLSDVLAHGDIPRAIRTASAYVPPRSRFAEMVRWTCGLCDAEADWEKANAALHARYPAEAARFNHSLPNAAIVLLGLLLGRGDFTTSLGITVMAGLDTDCTGATAGSILGCALGTAGIPSHWTEPFHDTLLSDVRGETRVSIAAVAARTHALALRHRGTA
jgi:hypothetical protein